MVNTVQNAQQIKIFAIWLMALNRLRPKLAQPAVWRSVLGGALFIFGLTYVWQANSSAAANVQIRQLRVQAAELKAAHDQLSSQIVQLQSLNRIAEASGRLGLVSLPKAQFAAATDNRVAAR